MLRNLHGYQVGHAYKIDDSVEDLCIARIVDSSPSRHSSLEKDESAWIAFKDMATLYAGQENMGLDVVFEPEARYVLSALEQSFYFKRRGLIQAAQRDRSIGSQRSGKRRPRPNMPR